MARRAGFLFGLVLLAAAAASLGFDLVSILTGDGRGLSAMGDLWFAVDRRSLELLRGAIHGHLSPALWEWIAAPLLRLPAVAALGVPGLALVVLTRRRARRGS